MTNTPATFKLHSPEQVREMFPDGRKPELRNIIRKAKDLGCCCKLGRGVGFTDEQVAQFFQAITCSGSRNIPNAPHTGTYAAPSKGLAYLKVREQLTEGKA